MNLDIKKRIDSIAHPEAIKVFFNFINKFIKDNSISEDDERFVLNVRNDYRKRFSVNLNSRLILYVKDGYEFGFMINQEDWSNFKNIPYLKKESFEKHDPNAFLVSFSFDNLIDNIDLFTKYWLKCCKEYLPSQEKSQYRKYNIKELYKIAMDDELLNEYLTIDIKNMTLKFCQIINELKVYLLGENNILNNFKISEVKDNSRWVWITDNQNGIGDTVAHYEIITRKNKVYTEIHFEGDQKSKDFFYNQLDKLPENIEWFKWQNSKSIRYNTAFDINDENLVVNLAKSLLYLEENIGNKVREVKNKLSSSYMLNKHLSMNKIPLNQILYGPPGTGKTYHTINKAIAIANPKFDLKQDRSLIKSEYERLVNEGQIVFTTFHQSMTYEDFIEGIKPLKPEADDEFVKYDVQNGVFKTIAIETSSEEISNDNFENVYNKLLNDIDNSESKSLVLETLVYSKEFTIYKNSKNNLRFHANTEKANEGVIRKEILEHYLRTGETLDWSSYTKAVAQYILDNYNYNKSYQKQDSKNHVLIIDEINRGNVSQIFGELITLIEEDKRLGNKEALEVTLPYSKEKFGVPSNLYIIGTMNTADRSVEALDTALRRRFVFEEMPPKYDLEELQQELFGFKAGEILKTINQRIEKLLDRDHQIGHAYFINKNESTIIDSFYKNIIPLLQEYFFGDYGKIGLVLGSGFIKKIEQNSVFANFEHLDYSQFEEKESYEIINHKKDRTGFSEAVQLLMNR